ncbi:hypothetical protein Ancab_024876 [Ancistrocladus abbreviatus]
MVAPDNDNQLGSELEYLGLTNSTTEATAYLRWSSTPSSKISIQIAIKSASTTASDPIRRRRAGLCPPGGPLAGDASSDCSRARSEQHSEPGLILRVLGFDSEPALCGSTRGNVDGD